MSLWWGALETGQESNSATLISNCGEEKNSPQEGLRWKTEFDRGNKIALHRGICAGVSISEMRNVIFSSMHCEPTGRRKRRPMTGYEKQSSATEKMSLCAALDCFVAIAPRNDDYAARNEVI
jgi:hypothetical protein